MDCSERTINNCQGLTFTSNCPGLTLKEPDYYPANPVDLTGNQLANSIISVNQFLSLANLTTASLAAMGGSVANFSASLIPDEAAALAAATGGATMIPSTQMSITASGLAYSRVSQTFNGTVTIQNVSESTISGPLEVVFTVLSGGVTLVNATGTYNGSWYLTLPNVSSLAPGQTATINVQFKNPSNAIINFPPLVYSGSLN